MPRLPINGIGDDLDSILELDDALADDAENRLRNERGSDEGSEFDA